MDDGSAASRVEELLVGVNDDWGLLSAHLDEYGLTCREAAKRLWRVWKETGVGEDDQVTELAGVTEAISRVWSNAVDRAETQAASLKKRTQESVDEICKIRAELGADDAAYAGGSRSVEEVLEKEVRPGANLREKYTASVELLGVWKGMREERIAEFGRLLADLGRMRARLGLPGANDEALQQIKFSLTATIQVKEELESLHATRQRREMDLEAILSRLRKVCIELGENDVEIAESAHPSLRFYREALPGQFQVQFRRAKHSNTEIRSDLRPEDIELDLTDSTFEALEKRINDTERLKAVREQQATELSHVLHNLWKVLSISEAEVDRGIHTRLLEGPTRLHAKSIDKCMNEVTRLEKAKAARLQMLVEERITELKELYESTHMAMPDLSALLPAEGGDGQVASGGLVSDALGKLTQMVEDVACIAEKRSGIIDLINTLESSKAEVSWLVAYEQDEDRYKGRDSNRKLQQALKVGRTRDKMPAMIEKLRASIAEWEETEHCPFMFNGVEYSQEIDQFAAQVQQSLAPKRSSRTAAKSMGSLKSKGTIPSQTGNNGRTSKRCSMQRSQMDMRSQVILPEEKDMRNSRNARSLHLSYRSSQDLTKSQTTTWGTRGNQSNNSQVRSGFQTRNNKRDSPSNLKGKQASADTVRPIAEVGDDPPSLDLISNGDCSSSRHSMLSSDGIMSSGDWITRRKSQRMFVVDDQDGNL